jgi:hypothetical protein
MKLMTWAIFSGRDEVVINTAFNISEAEKCST